jgi:hypothetical protein
MEIVMYIGLCLFLDVVCWAKGAKTMFTGGIVLGLLMGHFLGLL